MFRRLIDVRDKPRIARYMALCGIAAEVRLHSLVRKLIALLHFQQLLLR